MIIGDEIHSKHIASLNWLNKHWYNSGLCKWYCVNEDTPVDRAGNCYNILFYSSSVLSSLEFSESTDGTWIGFILGGK